jgi:dTMP kinase
MFASRAQNVDQAILPSLARGEVVLCDRFTDSSLVYQGIGRGLGTEVVYDVDRIACRGLVPHLTLVIDIDTEAGLARAHRRNDESQGIETRIDQETLGFHKKIREAYRQLATDEPRRVKLVDGSGSPEQVAELVWDLVSKALPGI